MATSNNSSLTIVLNSIKLEPKAVEDIVSIFIFTFLCSTLFLNILGAVSVCKEKKLHATSNLLFGNLCVMHSITAAIYLVTSTTFVMDTSRLVSEDFKSICVVKTVSLIWTMNATFYTLIMVALDRYILFIHPSTYLKTMKTWVKTSLVAAVWIIVLVGSIPLISTYKWKPEYLCVLDLIFHSLALTTRAVFSIVICTPVLSLYLYIFRKAKWLHERITKATRFAYDTNAAAGESCDFNKVFKLTHMCFLVLVVFVLCWLPGGVISLLSPYVTMNITFRYHAQRFTDAVVFLSAFLNPVIYMVGNDLYRSAAISMVCRKRADVAVVDHVETRELLTMT